MTAVLAPRVPALLRKADLGQCGIALRLWNGEVIGSAAAKVTVALKCPEAGRLFVRPTAGRLARAYVEELIDLDGALRDVIAFGTSLGGVAVRRRRFGLFGPRHTRSSDRDAVQFHYDVSNDFYALWLDRNMVYSCGYFRGEEDSLDRAQEQKLEHVCRKLSLRRGERLLDIGCGWGGLILWAAEHYRVRCTGITLSQKQHAYVTRKIRERGLEAYCDVRLADYRDLDPRERFDKIVSVGMFEHVGRRNLRTYFDRIHTLLAPGGLLLNHGIAASWMKGEDLGSDVGDFMDRYVFPDGELVHVSEALSDLARSGFEARDVESLRPHYAKTLWHWVERLDRNADAARQLVGERSYRTWRIYMAGCAHAFERGWISIYQILAGRPHADGSLQYPLTREHLYSTQDSTSSEAACRAAPIGTP